MFRVAKITVVNNTWYLLFGLYKAIQIINGIAGWYISTRTVGISGVTSIPYSRFAVINLMNIWISFMIYAPSIIQNNAINPVSVQGHCLSIEMWCFRKRYLWIEEL